MNLKDAFTILKSNQFMDYREVRKSYIDLVSVWHPDRFTYNERLRNRAIEEMKQINVAWETIQNNLKNIPNTHRVTSVNRENKPAALIRCIHCGTKNRVLKDKSFISSIKCGKCRKSLYADPSSTKKKFEDVFEEIRFCAVYSCSGRIQNGRCNQCGKTLEEGFKILKPANNKRGIRILLYIITGGLVCLIIYFIWPENTTNASSRSLQLHNEINGSTISQKGSKKSSQLNDKEPEVPLDKETHNITSKDIIIPFEIIKK
ncbi:MAG: hypothetical protein VR65_24790 [Desulfobulbaceae bacterium BRH_c16a]|nr:MAG: hypothetical protein VR65_24790 [Desulfobulbaceae bacterium BRH_c16a]